jgi:hypothetical protein
MSFLCSEAIRHFTSVLQFKPNVDTFALLHHLFAARHAQARRFDEAILSEDKAPKLALAAGFLQLEKGMKKWLQPDNFSSKGQ